MGFAPNRAPRVIRVDARPPRGYRLSTAWTGDSFPPALRSVSPRFLDCPVPVAFVANGGSLENSGRTQALRLPASYVTSPPTRAG
jgi:hypothetical protein